MTHSTLHFDISCSVQADSLAMLIASLTSKNVDFTVEQTDNTRHEKVAIIINTQAWPHQL